MPPDVRANDQVFQHIAIVVSDLPRAYQRVARPRHGTRVHRSAATARLESHAGGISAFYFRDPDRHFLEIIAFPKGKGQAALAAA